MTVAAFMHYLGGYERHPGYLFLLLWFRSDMLVETFLKMKPHTQNMLMKNNKLKFHRTVLIMKYHFELLVYLDSQQLQLELQQFFLT